MSGKAPENTPEAHKAEHGAASEVSWDSGQGRQPYANKGSEEVSEPHGSHEFAQGDRGELSGRNIQQLEQVKKKP